MKINDKDTEKELVSHYFLKNATEEQLTTTLQLSSHIQKSFKSNKLWIAVKEVSCGFWEKNLHKVEIPFTSLGASNEVTKKIKFDRTEFQVIVRIKQALNKKEFETVVDTKI